jgi:hypothetical protein
VRWSLATWSRLRRYSPMAQTPALVPFQSYFVCWPVCVLVVDLIHEKQKRLFGRSARLKTTSFKLCCYSTLHWWNFSCCEFQVVKSMWKLFFNFIGEFLWLSVNSSLCTCIDLLFVVSVLLTFVNSRHLELDIVHHLRNHPPSRFPLTFYPKLTKQFCIIDTRNWQRNQTVNELSTFLLS